MKRCLIGVALSGLVSLTAPGPARATGLEEILSFYAQGAGNGIQQIAQGLIWNVGQLTQAAPLATQGAMATGSTVAAGIAEVLQYDPAIREVLKRQAIYYGRNLNLTGDAFLDAMREFARRAPIGQYAHHPAGAQMASNEGAVLLEPLLWAAALVGFAVSANVTVYEAYQAYVAEMDAAGAEAEAFANNVRLLVDSLADGRQSLCDGVDLPTALRVIRVNSEAGRFPFLGVLEDCPTPAAQPSGPRWVLTDVIPNPEGGALTSTTARLSNRCQPPLERHFQPESTGLTGNAPALFVIEHKRASTIRETVNVSFYFKVDMPRQAEPGSVVDVGAELQVSGTHVSENASATGTIAGLGKSLGVVSCSLVGCGTAPAIKDAIWAVRFPPESRGSTFDALVLLSDGAGTPVGANCRAIYRYNQVPGS